MITQEMTLVRIYLREGEALLGSLIDYLHDQAKVRGVTVLRGVEGFSEDGTLRTVSLLNLSLDLPLIVEFYDEKAKAEAVITTLVDDMRLQHVVSLAATAYIQS